MSVLTKTKQSNKIGKTTQDKILDMVIVAILALMSVFALYPLWYTIIASVSNPHYVATGKVFFWPRDFTMLGYEALFEESRIWIGYRNSLAYTFVGTFLKLAVTLPAAYAMARPTLPYRNALFIFFLIPMYFSGGTIPSYLLVNQLGLMNTFWVLVIPHGVSTFNMMICRNYFKTNVPHSLYESAMLDGSSVTGFFFKFVIPLSKPIISVLALWHAIPEWNTYLSGILYIQDQDKMPLMVIIKGITQEMSSAEMDPFADPNEIAEQIMRTQLLKYAVVIVAVLPLFLLYPLVQKYLIGGIMVGALKE